MKRGNYLRAWQGKRTDRDCCLGWRERCNEGRCLVRDHWRFGRAWRWITSAHSHRNVYFLSFDVDDFVALFVDNKRGTVFEMRVATECKIKFQVRHRKKGIRLGNTKLLNGHRSQREWMHLGASPEFTAAADLACGEMWWDEKESRKGEQVECFLHMIARSMAFVNVPHLPFIWC